MAKRKNFNQTAILQYLKAKCEKCGKQIPEVTLTTHHRDGKSDNDSWDNIVIWCISCHNIVEGRDKKKRDWK